MLELEVRSAGELRSNGRTLYGHAARFNSEANLGNFVEIIRPGAFRKSLDAGTNVRALYDHESSALLGTTRGGTLKLKEDAHGLAFELALPDTTHGRDLAIRLTVATFKAAHSVSRCAKAATAGSCAARRPCASCWTWSCWKSR